MLRIVDEVFAANISVAMDITSGPIEQRRPDYPLAALQQVVRNAVMHRTYEGTNAPVRVTWFSDRIEILSPGGPFGQVTIENFGSPGVTDYRNRHLAEVLHRLGYVQRFGVGIELTRQAMEKNGESAARVRSNADAYQGDPAEGRLSAPIIAFFNNRGGVGTTTLVYHLAWMFSDLGVRVLLADLDPQADLSAACRGQDRLEKLLSAYAHPTIYDFVDALMNRPEAAQAAYPEKQDLSVPPLILGDLRLAIFEDLGQSRGSELTAAFGRILSEAADVCRAEVVLVDLAPNLGAINRAVLLAADYMIVPLAADLFSVQGMRNLGQALREWKAQSEQAEKGRPIGYVVQQHSMRLNHPIRSNHGWSTRIPFEYQRSVLGNAQAEPGIAVREDDYCLAILKHYHSLLPMAQEAQKPMFHLTMADGLALSSRAKRRARVQASGGTNRQTYRDQAPLLV